MATYQVVDENHLISSAFHFVSVPSAAWVDETGRIVRIDEGTYAKTHQIGDGEQKFTFGTDAHAPAVKDRAAKGAASEYVQSAATVTGNIREFSVDEQKQMLHSSSPTCFGAMAAETRRKPTGTWLNR